jgi:hypothetical protein
MPGVMVAVDKRSPRPPEPLLTENRGSLLISECVVHLAVFGAVERIGPIEMERVNVLEPDLPSTRRELRFTAIVVATTRCTPSSVNPIATSAIEASGVQVGPHRLILNAPPMSPATTPFDLTRLAGSCRRVSRFPQARVEGCKKIVAAAGRVDR